MSRYGKRSERRRKRPLMPMVYFLAELVLFWLVLSLIQVKFSPFVWESWAVIVFLLGFVYSVAKTIHIYTRQKDYPLVYDE